MQYKIFLILPTQLFEVKYLPGYVKKCKIVIWEHPKYFTEFNFNKKKLLLHRASMKYYEDYLKSKGYTTQYINYHENFTPVDFAMFDPVDKLKIRPSHMEESPNFLMTKLNYTQYREKTDKFFFNAFYMFGKSIVDIIPDVKSKDKENRKKMTKKEIAQLDIKNPSLSKKDNYFISKSSKYVNENFKNNLGNTDKFMFPVTHKTAKKWLTDFIKNRFDKFGDYQDFINTENGFMYHSLLSTSINIGLLNPLDIIEVIKKYKSKIPINSFEGYIRQLFWREYQRYTYIYFYSIGQNIKFNYFGNRRRLNDKWYTGTTGIKPLDDSIKFGIQTGYLHHINRLMVVGNYMNLYGISPTQGFKWFMEFSCDSYDWVMCQNVYGMAFFSDGGKTMRRPYISSSNYILKMSNYSKGEWSETWDELYRDFIKNHKQQLKKYRYYIR